jgi:hypothetical protein
MKTLCCLHVARNFSYGYLRQMAVTAQKSVDVNQSKCTPHTDVLIIRYNNTALPNSLFIGFSYFTSLTLKMRLLRRAVCHLMAVLYVPAILRQVLEHSCDVMPAAAVSRTVAQTEAVGWTSRPCARNTHIIDPTFSRYLSTTYLT